MIMMKWRVRREAGCNSSDQEDIRKSLDVLDRVLAEFDDDDGDSWRRSPPSSSYNGDIWHEHNGGIPNGHRKSGFDYPRSRSRYDVSSSASDGATFVRSNSTHSFQSLPIDGSSSSYASSMLTDQFRKVSPPPVPKRNPATRLSSHEDLLFTSDISVRDDNDKFAKRRSYAEGFNYYSSSSQRNFLGFLTKPSDDDSSLSARRGESPKNSTNNSNTSIAVATSATLSNLADTSLKNHSGNDEISRRSSSPPPHEHDYDLSPTSNHPQRVSKPNNQGNSTTEDNGNTTQSGIEMDVQKSPTVAQRRAKFERRLEQLRGVTGNDLDGDSYRSRSFPRSNREVVPKRSVTKDNDDAIEVASCHEERHASEESAVLVARPDSGLSPGDASHPESEPISKILLLDEKFAEVRRLIRTNQIKPLATPPPSFMPPPPPKPPRKQREVIVKDISKDCNSLPCDILSGPHSAPGDLKSLPTSFFSNGYLGKKIEDIPKMLPPGDVSMIPPLLGFSYSMEEDMSPGIKEILTSTPELKSRLDLSTNKSTFNSSVSSLGYSSSQSDLDLHNVSDLKDGCEKIPVDNLRSQTLPIGMKLGPDYYSERNNGTDCDSLDSYGLKNGSFVSPDDDESEQHHQQHFRSSSAPPIKLLEDEGDKKSKRSIFGMSKKIKSKNDCNGANSAVKSKTSLDDGIILRRVSNLGDEFPLPDFQVNKVAVPQEEKKRRSVWKSILRRK